MRFQRPSPALVIALLALFVALSGIGYAATGGNLILGQANSATSQTGLSSNNAGKALNITQQSTGTGATALGLNVPAGKTPFTVNSGTKVANLNGDKIDGLDSTAFLRTTGKAADSDKLDGLDSTAFLGSTAKAADSEQLDGLDSTQFIRGSGQVASGAAAMGPGAFLTFMEIPGKFRMAYACPGTLTSDGVMRFRNLSADVLNVFVDSGGANPLYRQVAPNDVVDLPALAAGDSYDYQVQGSIGIATIKAASVHRASDCHAQALTVING